MPSFRRLAEAGDDPATSSATWPRSRPSTPIVRSIVGWRLLWVISVGTVVPAERDDVPQRDRLVRCVGLVIGMSSSVSTDSMSSSEYCTPTKYWFC